MGRINPKSANRLMGQIRDSSLSMHKRQESLDRLEAMVNRDVKDSKQRLNATVANFNTKWGQFESTMKPISDTLDRMTKLSPEDEAEVDKIVQEAMRRAGQVSVPKEAKKVESKTTVDDLIARFAKLKDVPVAEVEKDINDLETLEQKQNKEKEFAALEAEAAKTLHNTPWHDEVESKTTVDDLADEKQPITKPPDAITDNNAAISVAEAKKSGIFSRLANMVKGFIQAVGELLGLSEPQKPPVTRTSVQAAQQKIAEASEQLRGIQDQHLARRRANLTTLHAGRGHQHLASSKKDATNTKVEDIGRIFEKLSQEQDEKKAHNVLSDRVVQEPQDDINRDSNTPAPHR